VRIAAFLPNHAPHFGRYWVQAAENVADVLTIEFVPQLTFPRRGPHVGADGASGYQIERFDLRPTRLLAPITSRVLAHRVQLALDLAVQDHGPIDLLHTHYYHQTHFVQYLARPTRYVHTEHSTALLAGSLGDRAHYPLSRAGLAMARRGLEHAQVVIPVSRFLADSMMALELPGAPYVVIPNPVDSELFTPGLDRQDHLVVSVGRLAPDKQPDLVLQGFAMARVRRPGLRLEFIGDGAMRYELERTVARLGLEDDVRFLGQCPRAEVAERVAQAAVYVNAAKIETFALAVAEALVTGTPVVGPDMAALPELVNRENGVLVRPDDPVALGEGIITVLDAGLDNRGISVAAVERYSAASVGAALDEVYAKAVR